jgi:hypothetical protein
MNTLWKRVRRKLERSISVRLGRRPFVVRNDRPLISFTFDDFPRSAWQVGGTILEAHGLRATYYASLGLMGREAPAGSIFEREDLPELVRRGHELGCHTFAHCHAFDTPLEVFGRSIRDNRDAVQGLLPGANFSTLSYPISLPRPGVKRLCERHFLACRSGGQTFNCGTVDLNALSAFFLEQCHEDIGMVTELIRISARARGWLILATHDICANPSPFGCTPEFFEAVVRAAVASGARVEPVAHALALCGVHGAGAGGERVS